MTRFLDVPALVQLLQRVGLCSFLEQLTAALHEDFLHWKSFEKSARLASYSPRGVIELMPVSDARHFAFKYVNGHPGNPAHGLPTVMAFGVLAEVATGKPLLLAELTLTTALRTAVTSALAARTLARPGVRRMALIGCGAQSEFQALAFHHLLGIDTVCAFDRDAAAINKLRRNLARWSGVALEYAASVAEAVRGADIVTTITAASGHAIVLTPDMLEAGMHLNAVGGDAPGKTELPPQVLRRASVFVEYAPQTRVEGEIQQMAPDFPVTELWQVLAGRAPGRIDAQQITLFDSVGFALEDYTALRLLHQLATEHGIGRELALVPTMHDPKDLFAQLHAPC